MQKKVLAVDNCPTTLRILKFKLQKENYQVETAQDGMMAFEVLEYFKPVLIIDLIMPIITGDKLCQLVRKMPEFDHVFIVILSAIAAEEAIDFRSLGADACVAKGPPREMMENILTVL